MSEPIVSGHQVEEQQRDGDEEDECRDVTRLLMESHLLTHVDFCLGVMARVFEVKAGSECESKLDVNPSSLGPQISSRYIYLGIYTYIYLSTSIYIHTHTHINPRTVQIPSLDYPGGKGNRKYHGGVSRPSFPHKTSLGTYARAIYTTRPPSPVETAVLMQSCTCLNLPKGHPAGVSDKYSTEVPRPDPSNSNWTRGALPRSGNRM